MTDLKGELLSKLLSNYEQQSFFAFLERGNWLIFQDVYPQLLLYHLSIKRKTNLFYLLPHFGVSKFMRVIWNHFFFNKNKDLLATSLIINEQNYIEERVVQNPDYKEAVFDSVEFKLQELLNLNQLLFPYFETNKTKLSGQTVHHFSSLHNRILLGKKLYTLLFKQKNLQKYFKWAYKQPHTGSRKDYCPQLFNNLNEIHPNMPYKRRIENCKLIQGAKRIYSPPLNYAWKNVEHKEAKIKDWYSDWRIIYYLQKSDQEVNGNIIDEYCETLERIELAIVAKETFL